MQAKIAFSSVISVKTGINYPYLEPGNEFWNRVRVPGSCYKSLTLLSFTVRYFFSSDNSSKLFTFRSFVQSQRRIFC